MDSVIAKRCLLLLFCILDNMSVGLCLGRRRVQICFRKKGSLSVEIVVCLACVLDGIAMSAKTSTALRKAMALRAVELSVRLVLREHIHERVVEQTVALSVPQMRESWS